MSATDYVFAPNLQEWTHLYSAATCRYQQDQVLWKIIGGFSATSAALVFGFLNDHSGCVDRFAFCLIGVGTAFVWLVMQTAALGQVKRYEDVGKALQERLGLPSEFAIFGAPTPQQSPRPRWFPRARTAMGWLPWGVGAGWVLTLVYQVFCA